MKESSTMTNREQIVALRGNYISKTFFTSGNLSIVMVGYEHYPEASGVYMAKDHAPITDICYDVPELIEGDWDDAEAMEQQFSFNLAYSMYPKDRHDW